MIIPFYPRNPSMIFFFTTLTMLIGKGKIIPKSQRLPSLSDTADILPFAMTFVIAAWICYFFYADGFGIEIFCTLFEKYKTSLAFDCGWFYFSWFKFLIEENCFFSDCSWILWNYFLCYLLCCYLIIKLRGFFCYEHWI